MKKLFSLVVVLFCIVGNVWGQAAPSWTVAEGSVSCYNGSDGQLTITFTTINHTGGYLVRLYKQASQTIEADAKIITEPGTFTFDNLRVDNYVLKAFSASDTVQRGSQKATKIANQQQLRFTLDPTPESGECGAANSISVQIAGGVTPYSVTITSSGHQETQQIGTGFYVFEDIPDGTYTLSVVDKNGCTLSWGANIDVQSTPGVTIALGQTTPVSCHNGADGTVTFSATGLPNYDFELLETGEIYSSNDGSGFFNGLYGGWWNIEVTDANGCKNWLEFEIEDLNPPVEIVSINSTDLSCKNEANDGTIKVVAQGGTGDLTYILTPGNISNNTGEFTNLGVGTYTVTVTDANGCSASATETIKEPTAITFTTDKTDPLCFGETTPTGSITVGSVSGGTPGYTFSLSGPVNRTDQVSPVFDKLPAGTYTVTVKDSKGCSVSQTNIILDDAVKLEVSSSSSTLVSCSGGNDGTITIAATGGKPGTTPEEYTFECNGETKKGTSATFNNLAAGTYTVTITDSNGCSITEDVSVDTPAKLYAGITLHTDVNCNGDATGALTAAGVGGTGPYTYAWSEGSTATTDAITGLTVGTYKITVADAKNCTADTTVVITEPDALVVSISNQVNVSCYGEATGEATATVTGGTPGYTWSWSPVPGDAGTQTSATAKGLSAGTYTVTVTDANGCTGTASVTITQPVEVAVTVTADKSPLDCVGETTLLTVTVIPAGDYEYQLVGIVDTWQDNANFPEVPAGNYTVNVRHKGATACTPFSGSVTIAGQPDDIQFDVTLTPNGCAGDANGQIKVDHVQNGQTPYDFYLKQNGSDAQSPVLDNTEATFTGLNKGTYLIVVIDDNGCKKEESVSLTDPAAIVPGTYTVTDVTCPGGNDGQIIISATGGTAPLSYSISPDDNGQSPTTGTFTGLKAGSYTINIADANSCPASVASIFVDEPATINFTAKADPAKLKCKDEETEITITLHSSHPGWIVEYSLDGTTWQTELVFENVPAGSYTVYARYQGKNCAPITQPVSVTEPQDALALQLVSQNDPVCHDDANGSATVLATGGWHGPYTYRWENSSGDVIPSTTLSSPSRSIAENLTGGIYTAYVTDAEGCEESLTVLIEPVDPISVQPVVTTAVSCFGQTDGTATVTASGGNGAPYSYAWDSENISDAVASNTNSNLAAGDHYVVVFDKDGCSSGKIPFTIADRPELAITFTNVKDASCDGATDGEATAVVIPAGDYVYQWNTVPMQNGATATGLGKGEYTVTVAYQESQTCKFTSDKVIIDAPDAIVVSSVAAANTGPLCAGETTTLTITATGDPDEILMYSLDGTTWQEGNTFDVGAGSYTAWIAYKVSGTGVKCSREIVEFPVTLTGRSPITITSVVVDEPVLPCGTTSTKITITADGGGEALEYRINASDDTKWQNNNVFTAGPGTYTACVRYATLPNCPVCVDTAVIVDQEIDITITSVEVDPATLDCSDSKATITVTASGATGKELEYNFGDGNGWVADPEKTDAPAGNYNIQVRYKNENCPKIYDKNPVVITAPAAITFVQQAADQTVLDCAGETTTIRLSATGETGRIIEYSINGTDWPGNTNGEFAGVTPGSYQVWARYTPDPACMVKGNNITITAPAAINAVATAYRPQLGCADDTTTIRVTATGEAGYILEYTINDGTTPRTNTTGIFEGVVAGSYDVKVSYKAPAPAACTFDAGTVVITAPAPITNVVATADQNPLDCSGANSTTTIRVTADGDTGLEYSITNGSQVWTNDNGIFTDMPAGTYTPCVRYAGTTCEACGTPLQITSNSSITSVDLTALKNDLDCGEETQLRVTVQPDPPVSGTYEYSINDPNASVWMTQAQLEATDVGGGTYVVYVRNTNDLTCYQTSNPVQINRPATIILSGATAEEPDLACYGNKTNIHVTASGSAGYTLEYILTNNNPPANSIIQPSPDFTNIGAGSYRITVKYAETSAGGCTSDPPYIDVVITQPDEIIISDVTYDRDVLKCAGEKAVITIDAQGNRTMEYSVDGVNWYESNQIEVTAAGTYTARVRYKTMSPDKCEVVADPSKDVTISAWAALTIAVTPDNITLDCNDISGDIKITATGETGKTFEFSVNGSSWFADSPPVLGEEIFTVGPGSYTPSVRYVDAPGCVVSATAIIDQDIDITIDKVEVTPSDELTCAGDKAKITVYVTGNGDPLEYNFGDGKGWVGTSSLDQAGAGNYHIQVRYAGGTCAKIYDKNPVVITAPSAISNITVTPSSPINLDCNEDRATITITADGSQAMQYSIRDGEWQDDGLFTGVEGGTYIARVRYADGAKCEVTAQAIVVNQPAVINITEVKVNDQLYTGPVELACNSDLATIEIVATGDQTRTLEYSIDGINFLPTSRFPNVGAGTYHPTVRYRSPSAGCQVSAADVEISVPASIVASIYPENWQLACDGTQTTRIIFDITDSEPGRTLEYSVDGGATWETDTAMLQKVGSGQHTAIVRYKDFGCAYSTLVAIVTNSSIQNVWLSADKTDLNCGEKTTITVNVGTYDGSQTLRYRLRDADGKVTAWQESDVFPLKPGGTYVGEVSYVGDESCIQYSEQPLTINQPEEIDITDVYINPVDLDCNGDLADVIVTANGHGAPLKYILTPDGSTSIENTTGIFSVGAGKYTLSVVYDGTGYCPADYPAFEITEPAAIRNITVTGLTTVDCAGDKAQITVDATGDSNRQMEYSADGVNWQDDKVLLLVPGTYNDIQVRYKQPDAACTVMYGQPVTVTGPAPIVIQTITTDKNTLDCSNVADLATITVTATGDPNLVYSFDGGLTYQTGNIKLVGSGVYYICVAYGDVTTQTCQECYPDPVVIGSNSDIIFVNVSVGPDIECNGGTTDLSVTVSGGNPIEVSLGLDSDNDGAIDWFGVDGSGSYTFTGLNSGKYYVSARYTTDPNCVKTFGPVDITEPDPVVLSLITYTDETGCKGENPGSAIIEGKGGSGSYEYQLNGGAFIPMPQNPFTVTGLAEGDYTIALKDNKGCPATDVVRLQIGNPDIMTIIYDVANIRCFGEANGRITVKLKNGNAPYTVEIINDLGQTVRTGHLANTSDDLKFDNLESGSYWIKVTDDKNCEALVQTQILQPAGPLEVDYIGYNICPLNEFGRIQPQTFGGWPDYISYWYSRTSDTDDYEPMYPDANGNASGGKVPVLYQIKAGQYQIIVKDQALCTDTTWVNIVKLEDYSATARTHGVRCTSENSGSVKILNPDGGNGGPYWFRVRYQGTELPVPGFEMYQYWPNDSIYGLPKGDFIIDMKDEIDVIYPEQYACNPYEILVTIGVEEGFTIDKITLDEPKCFGDKASITAITTSGTIHPLEYSIEYPDGTVSNWQDSQVFTGLDGGNYIVYAQEKAGGDGCTAHKDTAIVVPDELMISISVIEPKCEDPVPTLGQIDITVTGGTGQSTVTYNGITVTNVVQGDPLINEWEFTQEIEKGGKALIKVIDVNGCEKEEIVDVPYTPGLQWLQKDSVLNECPGDLNGSVTALAASVSGYIPTSLTYNLYVGEIAMGTPKETIVKDTDITEAAVFSGLANGTYTVSVHDDKNPHCYTDDWVVVIDNTNKITLDEVTTVDNYCNGLKNGRIVFTIIGNDPSVTEYQYSVNGGERETVPATGGEALVWIANLDADVYDITIYYGNCTHDEQFTINNLYTVNPTLIPSPVTGCYGGSNGSIEIQMSDITGIPYQYWYSDLPDGTFNNFNPQYADHTTISGLKSGDYKVQVQKIINYFTCLSDTVTTTINEAQRMQIDTTVLSPITCKGQYGKIGITITGGVAPYTITVTEPATAEKPVLTGSGSNYVLDHVTGGLYKISVEDADGCKDILELDIYAPKVVEISVAPDDRCAATTINLQVTKPASGTFVYTLTGPDGSTISGSPTTSLTTSWPVTGPGTYDISAQLQDNSCIADTTIMITAPITISSSVSQDCAPTADVTLTVAGGIAPYQIFFDGLPVTGNVVPGVAPGNYLVRVVDASSCEKTDMITVTINNTIEIVATVFPTICSGDGGGAIAIHPRYPANYTYQWAQNVTCVDATCNAVQGLDAGNYSVKISNGSCELDTTFHIVAANTLDAKLTIQGGVDPAALCPGVTFEVEGSVTGTDQSKISATWFIPGKETEIFDESNPVKTVGAVSGKVQLVAQMGPYTDHSGKQVYCYDTDSVEVITHPVPTITMAIDTIYIPKDEIYVLHTEITGDYEPGSILWTVTPDYGYNTPTYGSTISPIEIPAPEADKPYTLTLTVINDYNVGCKVSDSIYVSRALEFFIPNAFTPNDDGYHDTWKFRNIEQYMDYYDIQVAVFNRGGFQLYEGKGYNNSSVVWDGRRGGNDVPIGTYYYVVKLVPKSTNTSGKTHTFTGSVTIIR